MEACTKRMTEATKGLCKRDIKGYTKDCFIFFSWFSSNRLDESAMDVGSYMIDMLKTNKQILFKDAINNLKNDWPGGSYLVLKRKSVTPRDRLLFAIGYKYNP